MKFTWEQATPGDSKQYQQEAQGCWCESDVGGRGVPEGDLEDKTAQERSKAEDPEL